MCVSLFLSLSAAARIETEAQEVNREEGIDRGGGEESEDGCISLHKLCFGALWTDDVSFIGNKTPSNEAGFAICTDEAIVVPVPVFKRNETRTADTCNT